MELNEVVSIWNENCHLSQRHSNFDLNDNDKWVELFILPDPLYKWEKKFKFYFEKFSKYISLLSMLQ